MLVPRRLEFGKSLAHLNKGQKSQRLLELVDYCRCLYSKVVLHLCMACLANGTVSRNVWLVLPMNLYVVLYKNLCRSAQYFSIMLLPDLCAGVEYRLSQLTWSCIYMHDKTMDVHPSLLSGSRTLRCGADWI